MIANYKVTKVEYLNNDIRRIYVDRKLSTEIIETIVDSENMTFFQGSYQRFYPSGKKWIKCFFVDNSIKGIYKKYNEDEGIEKIDTNIKNSRNGVMVDFYYKRMKQI